jgi:hypothetical protein
MGLKEDSTALLLDMHDLASVLHLSKMGKHDTGFLRLLVSSTSTDTFSLSAAEPTPSASTDKFSRSTPGPPSR